MSVMQDHGHQAMQPTGYRTRDIEVPEGVRVVRVPEPTYDEEHVIVPCPVCFEFGAQQERERLHEEVAEALAAMPNLTALDLAARAAVETLIEVYLQEPEGHFGTG